LRNGKNRAYRKEDEKRLTLAGVSQTHNGLKNILKT